MNYKEMYEKVNNENSRLYAQIWRLYNENEKLRNEKIHFEIKAETYEKILKEVHSRTDINTTCIFYEGE